MNYTEFRKQAGFFDGIKEWASNKVDELITPVLQPVVNKIEDKLPDLGTPDLSNKKPADLIKPFIKFPDNVPQPIQLGFEDAVNDWFDKGKDLNVFEAGKIDPNIFNSDAFRNLKTNEEKWDYLQRAASKAGVFSYLSEQNKLKNPNLPGIGELFMDPKKLYELPQQILDQPEFFDSLVAAVDKGDMDALEFLQWAEAKWKGQNGTGSGSGAAAGGNGSAPGLRIKFSTEQINKIKGAAQRALWGQIKADPLNNIPKAIAMFLRMQGLDQVADFARDPFKFYAALAAVLLGGAAVLGLGDDEERQPAPVTPQVDPRMAAVPYSYRPRYT